MAVDPTTGRIITSASLTIAEADDKGVPRNQSLGPSRTAQERKQIRTSFLAFAEINGFASGVIDTIIDDIRVLEENQPVVYTIEDGDGGYFTVPLPRVENDDSDPRYYAIDYQGQLVVGADEAGDMDIRFDFDTLLEAHDLAAEVWTSATATGLGDAATFRHFSNNTPGDIEWQVPYETGITYINVRIFGRIAPISEDFVFDLILTNDDLTDTLSGQASGILRTQLTNQAYS